MSLSFTLQRSGTNSLHVVQVILECLKYFACATGVDGYSNVLAGSVGMSDKISYVLRTQRDDKFSV